MKDYSDNKFTKNQIIALIIMGLILISIFILRPDPYAEMDRYEQKQDQIRIQISNERRMKEYVRSEESRRESSEDQKRSRTATKATRSEDALEKFIAY